MRSTGNRDDIRRHSGWLIPGVVFFALLLLSGVILGWYLRPGPRPRLAPTEQAGLVRLSLHGVSFAIPANYIEDAEARRGGERGALTLVALFPSWRGYSERQARLFAGSAPDSALIRVTLRGGPSGPDAGDRLERIYRPHIAESGQGPVGLTRYDFAPESGYGNDELFSGVAGKDLHLFLCQRPSPEFPSPNCSAIDRPLTPDLGYSYRFKRAYLGRWQEIAAGVNSLIGKFRAR
jgi:hypothetical protein